MSEQQEQRGRYRENDRPEHGLMRMGIIALIAIVLLAFGSSAIQQSAWSEGYMTGLMAGGESDALAQYVLYNNSSVGHFSGFGFLWLLTIGLFFFMAAAKFVRMRAWQMAGRSESTDWRKEWRHGGPPWHRPCPDAEPDATTSDTPTSVADSALTSPAAAEVDTDSA